MIIRTLVSGPKLTTKQRLSNSPLCEYGPPTNAKLQITPTMFDDILTAFETVALSTPDHQNDPIHILNIIFPNPDNNDDNNTIQCGGATNNGWSFTGCLEDEKWVIEIKHPRT